MSIALEVSQKLLDLGGDPPLKSQIYRVKSALSWRDPAAANRIRHLINLEQRATPEQVDQIRAAHARHIISKLRARSAEDQRLLDELGRFIEIARQTDSNYFKPIFEEIGSLIRAAGDEASRIGVVAGDDN